MSFSFLFFSLPKSVKFSSFDLLNDDLFSLQGLKFLFLLDLLKIFNFFKSLDLHELIFFLFLNLEAFPISFLFFQLLFSDGGCLGVGDHFVHELDVIELLVGCFVSPILEASLVFLLLFFELIERHVLFLFFFEAKHLFFFGSG